MAKSFRVPKKFSCPKERCKGEMIPKSMNLVPIVPSHTVVCNVCGVEYDPAELIELAMLRAGIVPDDDWDDNL